MPPTYPPHRPVLAAEARAADARALAMGVPSVVLMEHAGRGLARVVASERLGDGDVAVLCGPGNNGGDGYACARFLVSWGIPVRVVRCAESLPSSADARLEHDLLGKEARVDVAASARDAAVVARALAGAAVVVDALFGTGARPLVPPYDAWVAAIDGERGARRVAADVPSRLDADDGRPMPLAVHAHVTAAMGFVKRGCTLGDGPAHAGRIVEVDIGLPLAVHGEFLSRRSGGTEPR
jgi:hydroxyethylthiazole kinase-like uncharacterized protein yjeF